MHPVGSNARAARRRLSRRPLRAATVLAAGLVAAGAAVGPAGATGRAPQGQGGAHALSTATLAKLRAAVATAEKVPAFNNPGPAVRDPKALVGKKVMIIPGTTHIPTCVQIADAAAQLATAAGMKPTIFETSTSGSQGWASGLEDAVHQHYAAVLLECALNPAEIAPQIAAAQQQGVRVTDYGATNGENAVTKLSAADADPYVQDEVISTEQALLLAGGKPLHTLVVESEDSPSNPLQLAGYEQVVKRYCPACTTTTVNVNIADWANEMASTVTSQLIAHPQVNTIFAFYSGELPFLLAGIESAHRTGSIKSFGTFGGGNPDLELQVAGPGRNIIMGDIFGDPTWTGYELLYQTALVLSHQQPKALNHFYTPNRLATPQNAESIIKTGGFGTAFVNGYRHLFGLPPLKGAALRNAALAQ